jgi:hypothetical protein
VREREEKHLNKLHSLSDGQKCYGGKETKERMCVFIAKRTFETRQEKK